MSRYLDLSMFNSSIIKNLVKTSTITEDIDKEMFKYANKIENKALIVNETPKAYKTRIFYKVYNRNKKEFENRSLLAVIPKGKFKANNQEVKVIEEN